ncbi:hypothetical protein DEI92_06215 [Curtobacterium sp. MCBD17_034]|uniref:hypothetical protein n=1 Tax=unclassified Curtobacterium TaxID=257496 RepID=UPI000DAAC20C|nr:MULTISPECIES: hypothetical protein [unclassified Curtobacterium]PZF61189.1 hypothetical protein DEI92_06215 [Curtobacterium sp. MCBD17_034]PZM33156.1 hypothetical protein DEI90_14415 [Curtobacterium sp. MCBD17_031]
MNDELRGSATAHLSSRRAVPHWLGGQRQLTRTLALVIPLPLTEITLFMLSAPVARSRLGDARQYAIALVRPVVAAGSLVVSETATTSLRSTSIVSDFGDVLGDGWRFGSARGSRVRGDRERRSADPS